MEKIRKNLEKFEKLNFLDTRDCNRDSKFFNELGFKWSDFHPNIVLDWESKKTEQRFTISNLPFNQDSPISNKSEKCRSFWWVSDLAPDVSQKENTEAKVENKLVKIEHYSGKDKEYLEASFDFGIAFEWEKNDQKFK